jgi:hypothetical protein
MGRQYKKLIICTKIIELRKLGTFVHMTKCKWENKTKKLHKGFRGSRSERRTTA